MILLFRLAELLLFKELKKTYNFYVIIFMILYLSVFIEINNIFVLKITFPKRFHFSLIIFKSQIKTHLNGDIFSFYDKIYLIFIYQIRKKLKTTCELEEDDIFKSLIEVFPIDKIHKSNIEKIIFLARFFIEISDFLEEKNLFQVIYIRIECLYSHFDPL